MSKELLEKIKANKKYSSISDVIIKKEIISYLKSNPEAYSVDKQTIKKIRSRLHRIYSSYQTKKKRKIKDLLEELKECDNKLKLHEIIKRLLSSTLSTKERLEEYPLIYKNIFDITGVPDSIMDIGCGLNIFSYPFMEIKGLNYKGYDINEQDIHYINKFISIMKKYMLNGSAEVLSVEDLLDKDLMKNPVDLVFIFKLFDLINDKKEKIKERLLELLLKKSRFIVVSFSTKTLSGKSMNLPRRSGFEFMLKRKNLKFEKFSIRNEVFYIISKQ